MKTLRTRIPTTGGNPPAPLNVRLHRLRGACLLPVYLGLATLRRVPGLHFHLKIAALALKLFLEKRLTREQTFTLATWPMDSVRYFEFDFSYSAVKERVPSGAYLDVSSPRLFPLVLLRENPGLQGDLLNPDARDLEQTRQLARASGLEERCTFHNLLLDEVTFHDAQFDLITSLSVIEHIPERGDHLTVRKLWSLLKPGGRLILSVPCAAEAVEEYIDFDEYGLYGRDEQGFVFGQRFYDRDLLQERVLSVTGSPTRYAIYGEKEPGSFVRQREEKLTNPAYPFWQEAWQLGNSFRYYSRIEDLPGWGVMAMEFVR